MFQAFFDCKRFDSYVFVKCFTISKKQYKIRVLERDEIVSTLLWIVYATFATISFIPVIKLVEVKSNHQYRILWILSLIVFSWSILIGLYTSTTEPMTMYYSRLLTYPAVFATSYAMFSTFQIYTKHRTARWFHLAASLFVIIELVLSLTNTYHQWILEIPYSSTLTREVFSNTSRGWFFMVHTIVCYITLMFGFVRMLIYLKKRDKQYNDIFPFPLMLISLIIGISLNIIHLFFYNFAIDPTYLFVVIITFILYMIIYKRDFNVNLILSSRKFLFAKMREMYIIADQNHNIIEYSKNLLNRFANFNLREGESVNEFYRKLKPSTVFYHDMSEIKHIPYDSTKLYLHVDDQEYRIDRFRSNGELILLYDETLAVKMMQEIEDLRAHDQMSNLYNRNYFEETRTSLEKEYPHLGLIMIDVDGLKLFNDYLGHREGDQLIIRFSNHLLKLNQIYDDLIPIRFGGDEFVLIAKKADQKKLDDIITHIIEDVSHKNPLFNISFSYGKAVRRVNEPLRLMLKRADERLYELKQGRQDYKDILIEALKSEACKIERKGLYEDQ